ncbi:MAG: CBS domain-containing protein [candidate division WOR-3 bacterium]
MEPILGEFLKNLHHLENLLKKRAYNFGVKNVELPFGDLLSELESRGDVLVKKYWIDLSRLREIRNILKHPHHSLTVLPTEICQERLKEIIEIFEKRLKAEDIMTKDVKKATVDSLISEIIKTMVINNYSQIPVVDSEDRVIGLITEWSILKWLNRKIDEKILELDVKIAEVGFFTEKDGVYKLVPRKLELEKIQEIFINSYETQPEPLLALIVTQSGKVHEKILGIITSEDAFLKTKQSK